MKSIKKIIIIGIFGLGLSVGVVQAQEIDPVLFRATTALQQAQGLLKDPELEPVVRQIIAEVQKLLAQYLAEQAEAKTEQKDEPIDKGRFHDSLHVHDIVDTSDQFGRSDQFIATYKVVDGKLAFARGQEDEFDVQAWNIFRRVAINPVIDKHLSYFAVYDDTDTSIVAYVERSGRTGEWLLAINLDQLSLKTKRDFFDAARVLAHEFSHIISLNTQDILPISERRCQTIYISQGCAREDSYIHEFVSEFWSASDRRFVERFSEIEDQDELSQAVTQWYEENPKDFVTPYSSTHPTEDFAESFSTYLFDDVNDYSGLAKEKLEFFDDFSEFRNLKKRVGLQFDL